MCDFNRRSEFIVTGWFDLLFPTKTRGGKTRSNFIWVQPSLLLRPLETRPKPQSNAHLDPAYLHPTCVCCVTISQLFHPRAPICLDLGKSFRCPRSFRFLLRIARQAVMHHRCQSRVLSVQSTALP